MIWTRMFRFSDALEHGRYYGLGMGAVMIGSSRTWTASWLGRECAGREMLVNMNDIITSPIPREQSAGLGMLSNIDDVATSTILRQQKPKRGTVIHALAQTTIGACRFSSLVTVTSCEKEQHPLSQDWGTTLPSLPWSHDDS